MGDALTEGKPRELEMAEVLHKLGTGSKQHHAICCGASVSKREGKKEGWADGVPDCSVGPRMSRSCQEVFKAKITIRGVPDPVSLVRKGFISPRWCSVVEPKKLCMTKMVSRRNME